MFGYIKPYKPELLVKEYEIYNSIYCGLCKSMGKKYGIISRLTLSYDATFLAMFLISIKEDDCINIKKGRCVVNPFKKCMFCNINKESFWFAGACAILMAYYKTKDDIHDSRAFRKIKAIIILLLGYIPYKRAKKHYPNINEEVLLCLKKQREIEKNNNISIDLAASPTAEMLSNLLLNYSDKTYEQNILFTKFGYFIGRWIYIIDATDDLEDDKKRGNFNPLISITANKTKNETLEYCNNLLNQTLSQAIATFNLINTYKFSNIIKNILEKGLPNIQKDVIFNNK